MTSSKVEQNTTRVTQDTFRNWWKAISMGLSCFSRLFKFSIGEGSRCIFGRVMIFFIAFSTSITFKRFFSWYRSLGYPLCFPSIWFSIFARGTKTFMVGLQVPMSAFLSIFSHWMLFLFIDYLSCPMLCKVKLSWNLENFSCLVVIKYWYKTKFVITYQLNLPGLLVISPNIRAGDSIIEPL